MFTKALCGRRNRNVTFISPILHPAPTSRTFFTSMRTSDRTPCAPVSGGRSVRHGAVTAP